MVTHIKTSTPAPFIFSNLMDKKGAEDKVARIIEITFTKTVKPPWLFVDSEDFRCGGCQRAVLKRGWRLFQSKENKTNQVLALCHFFKKNKYITQSLNFTKPQITLINTLYCLIRTSWKCSIVQISVSYYFWYTCFTSCTLRMWQYFQ